MERCLATFIQSLRDKNLASEAAVHHSTTPPLHHSLDSLDSLDSSNSLIPQPASGRIPRKHDHKCLSTLIEGPLSPAFSSSSTCRAGSP